MPAGEAVEFIVRVPTERDLPTTRVRVDFPPQVTVFSFADPPPGWRITPLRRPDGRFRGVVYSGGSIPVARYADFRMLGTPFEEGTAIWSSVPDVRRRAGQALDRAAGAAGGGVDRERAGRPRPGRGGGDHRRRRGAHGRRGGRTTTTGSGTAIWLGVIAIGISLLAALAVGFLWSTRPARLPEDGEGP